MDSIFLVVCGFASIISIVCVDLLLKCRRLKREAARLRSRTFVLEGMAYLDELTKIGNRRKYEEELAGAVARALRSGEALALVIIDVNDFKRINDVYGHPVGDSVLAGIAGCLVDGVRPGDSVCRIGGDEFALILPRCDSIGARVVVERCITRLETAPIRLDGKQPIPLLASFGGVSLLTAQGLASISQANGLNLGFVSHPTIGGHAAAALYGFADECLQAAKLQKDEKPYPVVIS